jgi:hypothetical protein
MERRGIGELIRSGRSLRNQGVQKVTPHLHVGTPIVRHGIECRRVKKRVKMENVYGMTSKYGGYLYGGGRLKLKF